MDPFSFDPKKKELPPIPMTLEQDKPSREKNVDPYYDQFSTLIKEVEGNREGVYLDSKGIPTAGVGFNLNDSQIRGVMELEGINPDEIISGSRTLNDDEIGRIKSSYHRVREPLIKNQVGGDLFDTLKPNQKAAVTSLGYQSLNNIGPNLRGRLAEDDTIGAMRELILNTNKDKDPGILARRLKEAEVFGGEEFPSTFMTFNESERQQVLDMLGQIKNEHTRKEMMDRYKQYLEPTPRRKRFQNLAGD